MITRTEQGPVSEIAQLFPEQGKWTEDDYFSLPETNKIVELSEGRLIITPSPTTQHQKIVLKLSTMLFNHVSSHNLGEIIIAPMDVRLYPGVIRQPDIVFMKNEHKDRITERYWGVPDLIIEVISESTDKEDKGEKFFEYEKAGVPEYWIVDPNTQTIDVFQLKDDAYYLAGSFGIGDSVNSNVLPNLNISVESIFKRRN